MQQYTNKEIYHICEVTAKQFANDNESVIQKIMSCSSFNSRVFTRVYRKNSAACRTDVPENCTYVALTLILTAEVDKLTTLYACCYIPDDLTYDKSCKSVAYWLYEDMYEDLATTDAVRTQRARRKWRLLNQIRSLDEFDACIPVLANDPLDESRFFEPAFDVYESIDEAFKGDVSVIGTPDEV